MPVVWLCYSTINFLQPVSLGSECMFDSHVELACWPTPSDCRFHSVGRFWKARHFPELTAPQPFAPSPTQQHACSRHRCCLGPGQHCRRRRCVSPHSPPPTHSPTHPTSHPLRSHRRCHHVTRDTADGKCQFEAPASMSLVTTFTYLHHAIIFWF